MTPGAAAGTAAAREHVNARSIAQARRAWAAEFHAGGVDSPELDARILVGHVLGLDHAALAAAGARLVSAEQESAIAALARRRLAHEPIARIVGMKEFWSLQLAIDAATLVPRPETETVVEAALAAIAACQWSLRAPRIADIGTGSGAILLALLNELPGAFGVGTDVSPAALGVARDNARRLGLTRAAFVACDMAEALHGPFDAIVSNPPYVASGDVAALPPEVRLFDPRLALDGGSDGLHFHRSIAVAAPVLLAPEGVLVVEIGPGQSEPVAALFAAAGLAPEPPQPDLNGMPRTLVARKSPINGYEA